VCSSALAHDAAVGEDDLGGDEVVDRHPVAAALMGDPAAERQPGDSGLRHDPARGGEPQRGGHTIDVGPRRAALHVHGAAGGVETDAAHRRQVDHQAAVDHGCARDVVPAAADRERQRVLRGEADGCGHVVLAGAARDRRRTLVDHAIPHAARSLVLGVVGGDHVADQALGERGGDVVRGGELNGHGCTPWLRDERSLRRVRRRSVPATVPRPSR
jgi:hypothetical protein